MSVPTDNFDFQNFYEATLNGDITAGTLVIPLSTVPAPSEGLLVINPDGASPEIIFYTSKGVNDVTCPADGRGFDSTTAQPWSSGTTIIMAPVGYMFRMLKDGSLYDSSTTGWTNTGKSVSSVTNNGNRSYDITFSASVATQLSPGMRLRTTRTVTAPTQCADLEASSSQYFNDTSVSGMTFTDDFVVSAWVKLESYPSTGIYGIVSRYNGTSGWELGVAQNTGQVYLRGYNAGAANLSQVLSHQSIPLGKWVHITAQLDMSSFTATSTTSYIMIDGADVPTAVARTGTNPTALVQAGNLEVGSSNSVAFFDGKIAQVAIFSAKVTQATMRTYMSQGLSGSETSLVSAYSLSNSIVDLTANANNLTAQGGALATATDSPFGQDSNGVAAGTTDYALVTKVSTTTATVQVPEGCTIPTSGGVSAVAYSTTTSPFGFTLDRGRWEVAVISRVQSSQGSAVAATWYQLGSVQLSVPVGAWDVGYVAGVQQNGTSGAADVSVTLGTSAAAETIVQMTSYASAASSTMGGQFTKRIGANLSSATTYYLNFRCVTALAGNTLFHRADTTTTVVNAIPAGI